MTDKLTTFTVHGVDGHARPIETAARNRQRNRTGAVDSQRRSIARRSLPATSSTRAA